MKRYASPLILLGIILASALMTIYSSTRVTPLIDYSYQVENAYLIFQGKMPYKDFFLVLPPGVYVVMALLMKLTNGYSHQLQLILTVIISVFTVVLTFRLGKIYRIWNWTIILSLIILIITGQATYPWPSYDIWATFTILISLLLFIIAMQQTKRQVVWNILAGLFLNIPMLMKQNIGIFYLLGMMVSLTFLLISQRNRQFLIQYLSIVFTCLLTLSSFLGYLYLQGALQPFIYQLFTYTRVMRNPLESVFIIRDQYVSSFHLLLTFPQVLISCIAALLIPSALLVKYSRRWSTRLKDNISLSITIGTLTLISLACVALLTTIRQDIFLKWTIQLSSILLHIISFISLISAFRQNSVQQKFLLLLPIPIIFAVHGAYLSHHVVSSSYGIIPLLLILLFAILHMVRRLFSKTFLFAVLIPVIASIVYLYSVSLNQQLLFPFVQSYGKNQTATYGRIKGLSTPGPWISRMETMFRFVEKAIPLSDSVAFLPHEDPFFAVTGRKNPLPFVQYGDSVYPRSPMIFYDLVDSNITWLIIKQEFQGKGLTFTINPIIYEQYRLMYQLDGYIILKRKE